MCFDGPARTAAREMWCTTATNTRTSTVPMRQPTCFDGPARTVVCYCYSYDFFGVCLGRYPPITATSVRCISGKSPRVYNNVMPCANVGSKPWHRCGCTDDTPCRLGDAGSVTFLPWFVPRTEPPAQLREVGPDRGHLLTESCSDVHLHAYRCRIGDEGGCCCGSGKPPPKYHCLYWRYLYSIEGVVAACSAAAPGVAAARAAAVTAAAAGVAAARGGGGPQEAIRPGRRWSRIV